MSLETPLERGSLLGSTLDADDAHAQHTLPGFVNQSGLWVPWTGDERGADVDVTRVNGPVRQQDNIAWYASGDGGRVAFNITTGLVTIPSEGESPLAALVNPSNSGKDIYLDLGEFGSSMNTTFKRWRGGLISIDGPEIPANNMGGGDATSATKMYIGGVDSSFTRQGGTIVKTAHIAAYQQYLTHIRGRAVVRPGTTFSWSIAGPGGSGGEMTASIYFEFWELPAA